MRQIAAVTLCLVACASRVRAQPVITLSTLEGTLGSEVTINGAGFGAKKGKVLLGETPLKVLSWSEVSIRFAITRVPGLGAFPVTILPGKPVGGEVEATDSFEIAPPRAKALTICEDIPGFCLEGELFGTKKGKILVVAEILKGGQLVEKRGRSKVQAWSMNPLNGASQASFILPPKLPPGLHDVLLVTKLGEYPLGKILIGLPPAPDLVPVAGPSGFCNYGPKGLLITVRNQGCEDAGPSTTTLTFATREGAVSYSQDTPPLATGESVELEFPVPSGCYQPNCGFQIDVDSASEVEEADEVNNRELGFCLG